MIEGIIESDVSTGCPEGTKILLLDSTPSLVGTFEDFSDSSFNFSHLPEDVFSMSISAPGYRDTTVTDINTFSGETTVINITLSLVTSIAISSAAAEHVEGGILITWYASSCASTTGFDIFRGTTPDLSRMTKRNAMPICSASEYRFLDICDNREIDHYYYIVEPGSDDSAVYGPIKASADIPNTASSLGQNYPNPFNPVTTIPYFIAGTDSPSQVTITFFDVSGRMIVRYDIGMKPAGNHTFEWNPSLSNGRNIPSGVYYCKLEIGKDSFTRKMIMLR